VSRSVIKTVLIGSPNESNQTIIKLIDEHKFVDVEHWRPATVRKKLANLNDKIIDVAITDLSSTKNPIITLQTLAENNHVSAVLAVNNNPSPAIAQATKLAGASGYVTADISEQELFDVIKTLHKGDTHFPEL